MKKFGVDISVYQGDFNFKKAINEGVKFVIIKGGGGDLGLYTDSKFIRNYNVAKKWGLPVGVYWFSGALNISQAKSEAEYFYKNVLKNRSFELPIYIDVESSSQLKLGKTKLTQIIKSWCEAIEKKGYCAGIYSSLSYFSTYMDDNALKNYTHWVACWDKNCLYKNTDIFGLWQFGGEINKIRDNKVAGQVCDQNYMLQDLVALVKRTSKNKTKLKNTTKKKNLLQIAKEVISGKWGNNDERKKKLTLAGYNYKRVQKLVNDLLSEIKVGDKVKLQKNATVYGSKKRFDEWVYNSVLYVVEIEASRIVIAQNKNKDVLGAVKKKYLTKV